MTEIKAGPKAFVGEVVSLTRRLRVWLIPVEGEGVLLSVEFRGAVMVPEGAVALDENHLIRAGCDLITANRVLELLEAHYTLRPMRGIENRPIEGNEPHKLEPT